jgi:hypothetical protein
MAGFDKDAVVYKFLELADFCIIFGPDFFKLVRS